MGRPLQVIGLLLMFIGLFGLALLSSGNAGLVALADPCVPNAATPAPSLEPRRMERATPEPARGPAKELSSYPVFAPTETLATPTPSPTPSPLPESTAAPTSSASPGIAPCPTHRHHLFGDGPFEFSATGGVDIGTHRVSALGYAQQNDAANLSMALHVGRRTERSSLSYDQSLGESNGTYNIAQGNVVYSQPQYYLGYGVVSAPSDTQLSTGSFNRGITVGIPKGRDELDLILARSLGINEESYRVLGLRHTAAYARGLLFSQTLYLARGDQSGGANTTFDLSVGKYKAGQTYRAEAALSNTRRVPGVPDGTRVAYAVHADYFGLSTSTSIGYAAIPVGFITLGANESSQQNFQFTNRRNIFKRGQLTFDFGDLFVNTSGLANQTEHETFNLMLPFGSAVTSQALVNFVQSGAGGQRSNERDGGLSLNELVKNFAFTQTLQGTHLSADDGSQAGQVEYSFGLTHPIWRGFLTLGTQRGRVFGLGTISRQSESDLSITEPVGLKAQIAYSLSDSRLGTTSGTSISRTDQLMQNFMLTRRFSPLVGARLSYTITRQSGILGGTARSLNVDVIGPLAFGTAARYAGRPNPNLPAVVEGHVFLQNEASAYGLVGNRGIPNVLITLDGGLAQRTDATGNFEFRFVQPGRHTLTISTGTLPAGVIPDSATQSFSIQGGQVFTADFSAGYFAGITGTVTTQRGGGTVPVAGIQLVVDGHERGYTGSDGVYQIGHLTPGRHVIAVDLDSLPAELTVSGPDKQTVDVVQGNLATMNWMLGSLGSIEGYVLYTADSGFGDLTGAKNVYVVADPGEHAAITDSSGHFYIDNLPAGQYTLSVDQDSLPDGEAIIQAPDGPITLAGSEAIQGITFKVGAQAKQVVFTFSGNGAAVQANFVPDQTPPGGVAELEVTTNASKVRSVKASGDFGSLVLHYVAARKLWVARVHVPQMQNGDYAMHVDVVGQTSGGADATLTVSNAINLVIAHGAPSHPRKGQPVRVVAKIAADVEEGDIVALEDGEQIKLPKPNGDVYSFVVHPTRALPLRGIIFTRLGERIPFVIQP